MIRVGLPVLRWALVAALCSSLCSLPSASALGQPAAESAACGNTASTAAMRECEIGRLKRADEGMNAAYRRLGARVWVERW